MVEYMLNTFKTLAVMNILSVIEYSLFQIKVQPDM